MVAIRNLGGMRCCCVFDALLASFAVGFLLPLMTAVAVAIKVNCSGPVLRRRVRICRNGRWIDAFEFRTMANPGRGPRWVHRFLQRTRIDTLPQVINVLRGELTFIGYDRPGFLIND
jgi:lipopolysaccharide/colanic/teichoic acid biosynthesis glycosyltransferase